MRLRDAALRLVAALAAIGVSAQAARSSRSRSRPRRSTTVCRQAPAAGIPPDLTRPVRTRPPCPVMCDNLFRAYWRRAAAKSLAVPPPQ
jgi:hypothetical protein